MSRLFCHTGDSNPTTGRCSSPAPTKKLETPNKPENQAQLTSQHPPNHNLVAAKEKPVEKS